MPSITQLTYIVAVDRHKHFGKAAAACHVSQPSLSVLIQKLEDELGLVVFDRSQKPVMTTEAGQRVINQARFILAECRKLSMISREVQNEQLVGDLYLGIIPTLAPYLLPLFLEKFAKAYPFVNLFIDEFRTDEIVKHLNEGRLDAGILATPLLEAGVHERPLFYEPFYLFVHEKHPLGSRETIGEGEMATEGLWLLTEGHCLRQQMMAVCALRGQEGILPNVTFESGNLETLKRLVLYSGGATLLPFLAVDFKGGKRAKKMTKAFTRPVPTREVSLVYRRLHLKKEILDALFTLISDCLPKELKKQKEGDMEVIGIKED